MNGIKSKITKSRLMGSMGLKLSWKDNNDIIEQLYILDAEGLGIADFKSIKNPSNFESKKTEDAIMSGLGSERIEIEFNEALYLINRYGNKTIDYGKELPNGFEEFQFILDMEFKDSEYERVFEKICKEFDSELEFVNYMIMRFVARDSESLRYFARNKELSKMKISNTNGSLLKNEVTKIKDGRYKCITIFDDEDIYYRSTIWISVDKENEKYILNSIFVQDVQEIDDEEALEHISKEEYIGIYKVLNKDFEKIFYNDNTNYIKVEFENGNMYILFNENNQHVNKKTYMISDDIKDIYYFVGDQLIVSNYSAENRIDSDERLSEYKDSLDLKDEFIFNYSIIYDFANSNMKNFYDFLMK